MLYTRRLIEKQLDKALDASGSVFIKGVKACGKTETALRFAKSEINLQKDPRNRFLAEVSPDDILQGDTPRLIDEWQEVPSIWNQIKIETDNRKAKGQFILTGSATLKNINKLHSGAGRIITIAMSTLSWVELGYSNSSASLKSLLTSNRVHPKQNKTELKAILERMVIGGWPTLIGQTEETATITNSSYIDLLLSDDISHVAGIKRNKSKAEKILKSLSRNIASPVEISTIASDIIPSIVESKTTISRQTASGYLDDLKRLMILVEQPAWNVHIRSTANLRTTPKKHLVDTSLVCASLGLSSKSLLNDLNFSGLLFESLVFHDMTIYASINDAKVSYYRDSFGREVDMIVEKRDGSWSAFEVKLGDVEIDLAAEKLLSFVKNIHTQKSKSPSSLNIITGTGLAYTRSDGINVLPLSVLGP